MDCKNILIMSHTLLIIEDDASLNQMLQLHFEDAGYRVKGVKSCTDGLELLKKSAFDLILLDQQLPDGTGLELLRQLCSEDPGQAIVMMTGQHDLELAIQAIKEGAADFIHKPIKIDQLQIVVDRVLENRRLSREVEALQPDPLDRVEQRGLIGRASSPECLAHIGREYIPPVWTAMLLTFRWPHLEVVPAKVESCEA